MLLSTLRIFFLVTAVIVVGSEIAHRGRMAVHREMLALRATDTVELQRGLALERLRLLMGDTLIAAAHTDLEDWIRAGRPDGGTALRRLEDEFVRMSELRGVYDQIRLIDARGMERVRVNHRGGVTRRVPAEELQDKRDRYYFEAASRLSAGELYISPFDFNVEGGVVELPARPVVRFATPVRSADGALEGVVVLNYDANDFLELIVRLEPHPGFEGFLLDAEGRDLLGTPSEAADARTPRWPLLASRFPEETTRILDQRQGQFQTEGGIFTFATIDPWESVEPTAAPVSSSEQLDGRLELVHRIPASVLAAAAAADRRSWWIPLAFFECLTLLASFVIARLLHQRRAAHLELERKAEVDPLTGLWNRRKLFELAALELRRGERFGTPVSVGLVDLDLFKHINDEFGHQAGDEVLRLAADAMLEESREVDIVSRYGGEEFMLLFPGTDEAGACVMADRIREAITRTAPASVARRGRSVTASIGIAERRHGESLDELLHRADDALYAAKRRGRNRVVAHSSLELDAKDPDSVIRVI